jgi:IclR family transcriptional regulator, pca regulon regulatory protein
MNAAARSSGKRSDSSDFVEALARGLDVIKAFGPTAMELTVSEVAARTGLARPTARRLLMTLEHLGYAHSSGGEYSLTTKTLELGTSYIAALGIWDVAQPHLVALVAKTGESSSMSQLDGSDIVYTARAPVAKIIALSVHIGTRFPAVATSMGRVLLADLPPDRLDEVLEIPSQSGIIPRVTPTRAELDDALAEVRERGWAIADELLSAGIRSVAAPVKDRAGRTAAAMNVTAYAGDTSIQKLTDVYRPLLVEAAAATSEAWAHLASLPVATQR